MKNYIINGAMKFDQNHEGSPYYSGNYEIYSLDQWRFAGGTSSNGQFFIARSNSICPGFSYHLNCSVVTPQSSLAETDNFHIEYPIEGISLKDWSYGSSDAVTLTLSFYAISNTAGEKPFAIMNGINTRSYVSSFIVNSPNVWEKKVITIPGDQGGIWSTSPATFGMKLLYSLGVGATYTTSTTETWLNGAYWNKAGTDQLILGANNFMYITGAQLEIGNNATNFEYLDPSEELRKCQRFYFKTFSQGVPVSVAQGTAGSLQYISQNAGIFGNGINLEFPTQMCAVPNITCFNPVIGNNNWYNQSNNSSSGSPIVFNSNNERCYIYNPQIGSDGAGALLNIHIVANARLGGS